jgi:hypothetical protein
MPDQEVSSGSRGILAAIVVILLLGAGYFFYNKAQTNTLPIPAPTPAESDAMMAASPTTAKDTMSTPSAKPGEQMTITILEQNKSRQAGIATITELGNKVSVKLQIAGASSSAEPAHIHAGKCPKPGEVKYPLTDVVGGMSETMLDVSLSTLKSMMPLAINIHKSKAEIQNYVACGDLQ